MKRVIKILVADNHLVVRHGVRIMLENQNEFVQVITEAENGAEVIDIVLKNSFDVILLDIEMPRLDGISALRTLRDKNVDVPVLVMSIHDDRSIVQRVIDAGANGYILKDVGIEEIVKALITVVDGGSYFGNEIAQVMIGNLKNEKRILGIDIELTRRESQILRMIAQECSNQEIAKILCISGRTVEGHKKNLTSKLGVRGSVGLTRYAYKTGLIE